MRTPAQILTELLALVPSGFAWTRDQDGKLAFFLSPTATEFARIESFAELMLVETDPGEANYLLTDYERVLGPDPAGRDLLNPTVAERQAIALQRWTARGGASPGYFIALAASVGITVTIRNIQTTKCGAAVCGAASCIATPEQFKWIVTAPLVDIDVPYCGAAVCGAAFCGGQIVQSPVEALFAVDTPAHTQPIYEYT